MREITHIIIHCAATPPSMDVGADEINQWHLDRGWSGIGYHGVFRRNGQFERGRPMHIAGAHARGFNANSIGLCLIGGVDEDGKAEDNFTAVQKRRAKQYVEVLQALYDVPDENIIGHRDLPGVTKDCPSFDVQEWWNER